MSCGRLWLRLVRLQSGLQNRSVRQANSEPSESASVGADTEGAPSQPVPGWRRQRLVDGDRFGRVRLNVLLRFNREGNGLARLRTRGVTNGDQC